MSQTHTSEEQDTDQEQSGEQQAGSDPPAQRERRRGRRRRDSHSGDRCRMCGRTVIVDDDGRCRLGHQVVPRAEMALRIADRPAHPDHDQGPTVHDQPTMEIDLRDGLPPTVPAWFTTTSPTFAERAPGPPHDDTPDTPLPGEHGASESPVSEQEELRWSAEPDPPFPGRTVGIVKEVANRRWVPGLVMSGVRLARPDYLPAVAAGRRLAQPGDHALPVMEQLPPLPGPAAPDGPPAARALFEPPRPRPTAPAAPAAPSVLPPTRGDVVSVEDLEPTVPSVLDVGDLPRARPRTTPVYEPEPIVADEVPARGPLQVLAASMFVLVLVALAWYLAETL